jgi:hypothetical protein
MPIAMEEMDELAAVNSELRFITLELMKISASQDKSFDKVLREFVGNAFKLKRTLNRSELLARRRH